MKMVSAIVSKIVAVMLAIVVLGITELLNKQSWRPYIY